jgi:hypothetical protein
LSIHPLNLAPFCTDCNQVRKGRKDALAAQGVRSLHDIYHPYIRGARDDVHVVVQRNGEEQPQIHLLPAGEDEQSRARLNSLIYILDLENFWQGTLCDDPHDESLLEAELESFLRNATQDERTARQQYDDLELRQRFARISQGMTRDIGRIPYRVATRAYAQWLATDEQAARRRRCLFTRALGLEEGSANPLELSTTAQRAA